MTRAQAEAEAKRIRRTYRYKNAWPPFRVMIYPTGEHEFVVEYYGPDVYGQQFMVGHKPGCECLECQFGPREFWGDLPMTPNGMLAVLATGERRAS